MERFNNASSGPTLQQASVGSPAAVSGTGNPTDIAETVGAVRAATATMTGDPGPSTPGLIGIASHVAGNPWLVNPASISGGTRLVITLGVSEQREFCKGDRLSITRKFQKQFQPIFPHFNNLPFSHPRRQLIIELHCAWRRTLQSRAPLTPKWVRLGKQHFHLQAPRKRVVNSSRNS